MTILIVEKDKPDALYKAFINICPVMLFSSPKNITTSVLKNISQLRFSSILVDLDDFVDLYEDLNECVDRFFKDIPRYYFSNDLKVQKNFPRIKILSKPVSASFIGLTVKREQEDEREVKKFNDIELCLRSFRYKVTNEESWSDLSFKEFKILNFLIESVPGKTISRNEIKQAVWGNIAVSLRTIDSHVSRLRQKLHHSDVQIKNVYGGGYLLE